MIITWDSFWATFWPGLASTIVGVLLAAVLGIPAGLAIDRFVRRRTAQETRRVQARQLGELRAHLCDAIDRNVRYLSQLAQLPDETVFPVSGLETATWDIWKPDVVRLIADPILRGDLARFFGQLEVVDYLNREVLRLSTSVDAAMGGAPKTRKIFHDLLTRNAGEALTLGQDVSKRLTASQPLPA